MRADLRNNNKGEYLRSSTHVLSIIRHIFKNETTPKVSKANTLFSTSVRPHFYKVDCLPGQFYWQKPTPTVLHTHCLFRSRKYLCVPFETKHSTLIDSPLAQNKTTLLRFDIRSSRYNKQKLINCRCWLRLTRSTGCRCHPQDESNRQKSKKKSNFYNGGLQYREKREQKIKPPSVQLCFLRRPAPHLRSFWRGLLDAQLTAWLTRLTPITLPNELNRKRVSYEEKNRTNLNLWQQYQRKKLLLCNKLCGHGLYNE